MTPEWMEQRRRLEAVVRDLDRLAALEPADASSGRYALPSGRWEWRQSWAHVAEFVPYWTDAVRQISGAPDGSVEFGRSESQERRQAAWEESRTVAAAAYRDRIAADVAALLALGDGLDPAAWTRRGVHIAQGPMPASQVVQELLVEHLEEHAEQLQEMLPG